MNEEEITKTEMERAYSYFRFAANALARAVPREVSAEGVCEYCTHKLRPRMDPDWNYCPWCGQKIANPDGAKRRFNF